MQSKLLINGEFVAGEGPDEAILAPATGDLVANIASASKRQVDDAVAGAREAFARWSQTTPAERSALLLRLADGITANADEFAKLESLNCGKPLAKVR